MQVVIDKYLRNATRETSTIDSPEGMTFQPKTVTPQISAKRRTMPVCVFLLDVIDGARFQVQIDTGFGDALTPGPEDLAGRRAVVASCALIFPVAVPAVSAVQIDTPAAALSPASLQRFDKAPF